jgi:hypothetical protein
MSTTPATGIAELQLAWDILRITRSKGVSQLGEIVQDPGEEWINPANPAREDFLRYHDTVVAGEFFPGKAEAGPGWS